MSDNSITLTPSDVIGAVQRGLAELGAYLNQPAMAISVPESLAHLSRVGDLLSALEGMQDQLRAAYAAQNGNGADAEARAN